MTLQAIANGPPFPGLFQMMRFDPPVTLGTAGTMDAAAEKVAFAGWVMWADKATHTIGSSSKIHVRIGSATWANGATAMSIGVQDVESASGVLMSPDGTFDVRLDITGGAGLTANAINSFTLSTAGSKSVGHQTPLSVVFDMTARGGADSVIVQGIIGRASGPPFAMTNIGSWAAQAFVPNVLLEADDGTLGTISGSPLISASNSYSYQDSTNPDERGLIFQVPFRCKIDAVKAFLGSNSASADSTLTLYSNPLGTPVSENSLSILGEQGPATTVARLTTFAFTETTLEPGVDYCLAFRATGAAAISLGYVTLADAAHRTVMGLANCRAGNRNNGSGAFSETTTEFPLIFLQISALDDGIGAARANFNIGVI